jgi:hypothetical protein
MALKRKGRPAPQPVYSVHDVFTPTRPAASLNYVARPAIDDRLVDALRTPGKQVIVYGESGSGKSTLLRNKLQEVYEAYIKTQCSAAMSYVQLILDAFDQLDEYYVKTTTAQSSRRISSSVGSDIKAIKFELAADRARGTGQVMERLLPPQLNPRRLAALFGELKMCWLIEDFHKIREHEKVLFAHALKIFSDMSDTYPEVKTITIGATETAHQVVDYDLEMTKRVSELLVPLMTHAELRQIISKGEELLNVDMSAIKEEVVDYSVGMPSVCHQICLNVCLGKGIEATQPEVIMISLQDFAPAVRRYMEELSDTIKARFDGVTARKSRLRFDNARLILTALAAGPVSGMPVDDVLAKIRETEPKYPKANLSKYLKELSEDSAGPLLRLGIDGTCRFAEPAYHTVAKLTLIELPSRRTRDDKKNWSFSSNSYLELVVAGTVAETIYHDPLNWNWFGTIPTNVVTASPANMGYTISGGPTTASFAASPTNFTIVGYDTTAKQRPEIYVAPPRRTRSKGSARSDDPDLQWQDQESDGHDVPTDVDDTDGPLH